MAQERDPFNLFYCKKRSVIGDMGINAPSRFVAAVATKRGHHTILNLIS